MGKMWCAKPSLCEAPSTHFEHALVMRSPKESLAHCWRLAMCDPTGRKDSSGQKGQQFGRWTVLGDAPSRAIGSESQQRKHVRVECTCGLRRTIAVRQLRRGTATGCGTAACRRRYDARALLLAAASRLSPAELPNETLEALLAAIQDQKV